MKRKYILKKNINKLLTKIFIIIIILIGFLIIKKRNPDLVNKLKNDIFSKSLNFIKINKISKKLLGKEVLYYKDNDQLVSSNVLVINSIEPYFEGEKIKVSENAPIGTLESGIAIYKGNKENFNNTVIIQGIDGYNIWYGNLENIDVNLYGYLDKNTLIGNSKNDYIYLLIEKDGKYIKYEDYKKDKN